MTAAELIAHLESGGLIAKAIHDSSSIQFLRFEIYQTSSGIHKHLGVYGWGSALSNRESRLLDVLQNPHEWVKVDATGTSTEVEEKAKKALEQIGHYDSGKPWKWILTAQDTREVNVPAS
jgi:hypothetical protein